LIYVLGQSWQEGDVLFFQVNLPALITRKAIPVALSHLDTYLLAKEYSSTFQTPVRGNIVSIFNGELSAS
jgi:hypothetical protein